MSTSPLLATAALAALIGAPAAAAPEGPLTHVPAAPCSVADAAELAYGNAAAAPVLATANQLERGAQLQAGQQVRIPVSRKIQVRRVTGVASLAKRHLEGRHRAAILAAVNNLKPNETVKALTVITIPAVVWHVVQKGDSMRSLSRRYYLDDQGRWLLRQANGGRTSNRLEIGELIAIPVFAPWSDIEAVEARLRQAQQPAPTPASADAPPAQDQQGSPPPAITDAPTADPTVATVPAAPDDALEDAAGAPSSAPERDRSTTTIATLDSPLIRNGVDLYRRGDYLAAVAYFRRALLEPALDPSLRVAAYVWLGASYVAVDEVARAEEAMRAALRADPALELDPAFTSPKILQVLKRVRDRTSGSGQEIP